MGAGAVVTTGEAHYAHLLDNTTPWWKKSRTAYHPRSLNQFHYNFVI